MKGEAKQRSAESAIDRKRFSAITGFAFALSPLYGVVAFPPVVEMLLLTHSPAVPFLAGAALGLVVPIAFRVWRSPDHAIGAIKFVVVASPLTYAILFIMCEPVSWVQGSLLAVLEYGLAIFGAAGLSLAITWSSDINDGILRVHN